MHIINYPKNYSILLLEYSIVILIKNSVFKQLYQCTKCVHSYKNITVLNFQIPLTFRFLTFSRISPKTILLILLRVFTCP